MSGLLRIGLANAAAATALAVIVSLAVRGGRLPALARALWLLVLLKLLTPPLFEIPLLPAGEREAESIPAPVEPAAEELWIVLPLEVDPFLPEPAAEPAAAADLPVRPLLGAVWIGGALLLLGLHAVRLVRFRAALRGAEPAPAALAAEAGRIARRLGLARPPEVRLAAARVSPLTLAVPGRAVVVLPAPLVRALPEEETGTLLAHEIAHLARGDHLVRWVEMIAVTAWWWLPVAWWARRRLRAAEEVCCDARVLETLPGGARAYARALLATVDFLAGARAATPPLASGVNPGGPLERRFRMILADSPPRARLGRSARLAVLLLALFLLPLTGGPAAAQEERPAAPAASPGPPPSPSEGVEARLDRLEKLTGMLVEELQALRAERAAAALAARQVTADSERARQTYGDLARAVRREARVLLVVTNDGRRFRLVPEKGRIALLGPPDDSVVWETDVGRPIDPRPRIDGQGGLAVVARDGGQVVRLDPERGVILQVGDVSEWIERSEAAEQIPALQAKLREAADRIDAAQAEIERRKREIELLRAERARVESLLNELRQKLEEKEAGKAPEKEGEKPPAGPR